MQAEFYQRAKQERQEVLALQRVLRQYKGTKQAFPSARTPRTVG